MTNRTSRTLHRLSAVLLALFSLSNAHAQGDGRYQAIVLHEGGSSSRSATLAPKVFILDSREGHMWIWEQNAKIERGSGGPAFGTLLTYQGKLREGSRMGEVVNQ